MDPRDSQVSLRTSFTGIWGRRPWLPDVALGLSCAPSTWCLRLQFGAWWAAMVLTWRAASAIASRFVGGAPCSSFLVRLGLGVGSRRGGAVAALLLLGLTAAATLALLAHASRP